MAQSLAQVLRQLARKKAEAREIKRVEVIGVMPDGTHFLASGEAAKVSGRAEFRVGEIVDVLPGPDPLILGHKWQKGDVPTVRVRQQLEEVEEIIMTRTSNPDGGLDHFLRSWRGIFYLDFRSALAAAGVDPSAYIPFLSSSRFPEETGQWTRFGQKDNTIAVLSHLMLIDDDTLDPQFIVIYLFEIKRPEKSDLVPVTEDVKTVGGEEYQIVDLELIGLYDFAPLSVNTGVSVAASGSTRVRQRLYHAEALAEVTWDPDGPEYRPSNYTAVSFSEATVADGTHTAELSYEIVLDFAHRYLGTHDTNRGRGWQLGGTGFTGWNYRYFSHFSPPHPTPYLWRLLDYWIDIDGHPIVVMQVENTWQDLAEVFKFQEYVAGVVVDSTIPVNATVGPEDLVERPIFAVRLLGGGVPWVGAAELVASTCETALTVNVVRDQWTNVPGWSFVVIGELYFGNFPFESIRVGLKTDTLVIGGPTPGLIVGTIEGTFFPSISVVPPENETQGPPAPPGASTSSGSFAYEQHNPGSYASSGAKVPLQSLFKNTASIGQKLTRVAYIYFHGTSGTWPDPGWNSNVLYLIATETIIGFVVGGAPSTDVLALLNGRSRQRGDDDCDLYFVNRHALALLEFDPISNIDTFEEELILGLWRLEDDEDSAVIFGEFPDESVAFSKPNPMLNRDAVLLEHPASEGRRIASVSGDLLSTFPDDLGLGLGPVFSLLAPDRLYDKRDSIGRFRSLSTPESVLSKPTPKPLPAIDALGSFSLFLSTPPLVIHTVGIRTDKVSG